MKDKRNIQKEIKKGKEVKKMKLRVTIEKPIVTEMFKVQIECVDAGDYPSRNIFKGRNDFPAYENFLLEESSECWVACEIGGYNESRDWVHKQIVALKKHLELWRKGRVPEIYEVEI